MDMENNHFMLKQKMGFFDILKEALVILCNFIVFAFFTSLPFFCFMVLYQMILQTTFLVETSKIPTLLPALYNSMWSVPTYITRKLTWDFSLKTIRVGLLYLGLLHFVELLNVMVSADLASKIRAGKNLITLREMMHKPVDKSLLRGSFTTSVYVLLMSTCTLLGLIWLVTNYTSFSTSDSISDLFSAVVYGVAFVIFLTQYLKWSAVWNTGIVISILQKKYRVEALAASRCFVRGNEHSFILSMLAYVAWGTVSWVPCVFGECDEVGSAIVALFTYFCLVNVLKWVICVVHFCNCKKQILEEGREVKAVDEEERR